MTFFSENCFSPYYRIELYIAPVHNVTFVTMKI
jgi:hypothetical protein